MKKRGFTLVELLAVIIILGIIALITTSVILGVIENSRKEAFRSSVYGVLDSVDYYILKNEDKIPDEGCIEVDIQDLPLKNKENLKGSVEICSDGSVRASDITDGHYHASGPKEDLTVTDDETQLPDYKPSKPTITASDGKLSGAWHAENYTLTIKGKEGLDVYYGTTENPTTKGTKIESGTGLNQVGTQKYYAKVCNEAGSCSDVATYIARLDTCNVTASITGDDTTENAYSATDVTLTANSGCETSDTTYEWYKRDNTNNDVKIDGATGRTYKATESGIYTVIITLGNGRFGQAQANVYIDKTTPTCKLDITGTKGSNNWYTSDVEILALGTTTGESELTIELKNVTSGKTIKNPYIHGSDTTGTKYTAVVTNKAGTSATCEEVTIKKDATTPSKPTITVSDGKTSGSWHTSAYKLSLSGVTNSTSGITYYIDGNNPPTTAKSSLSSGKGISTVGSQTYYARACNGAGTCSGVVSYIARFDTCEPDIKLTYANPNGTEVVNTNGAYFSHPVYVKATSGCSGGEYSWYINGETKYDGWTSTETDNVSELDDLIMDEGQHEIEVILSRAGDSGERYASETATINLDFTNPTVTTTVSTTGDSATIVSSAADAGSGINPNSYQVRYKLSSSSSWTTLSSSTNSKTITGLMSAMSYDFATYACDKAGKCVWSSTVTRSTATLPLPELIIDSKNGSADLSYSEIYNMDFDSSLVYSIWVYGDDFHDDSYASNSDNIIGSTSLTGMSSGTVLEQDNGYTIDLERLYNNVRANGNSSGYMASNISFLSGGVAGDSVEICVRTQNGIYYTCNSYTFADVDGTAPSTGAPSIGSIASRSIMITNQQYDSGSGMDASKYVVQYKPKSGGSWKSLDSPNTRTATITGLNPNTTYAIKTYACDKENNCSTSEIREATTEDYIYNCVTTSITYAGYKVTCDIDTTVTQVNFPTWTVANGQDDLGTWPEVKRNNNVIVNYTVKTSEHNYESGDYITHVYALSSELDTSKVIPLPTVTIPDNGPYTKYKWRDVYGDLVTSGYLVLESSNTINPYIKVATTGTSKVSPSSTSFNSNGDYLTVDEFLEIMDRASDYKNANKDTGGVLPYYSTFSFSPPSSYCSYASAMVFKSILNSGLDSYYYLADYNSNNGLAMAVNYEPNSDGCDITLKWDDSSRYPIIKTSVSK